MSSMLTSQGLVFATAMAVSAGTIILFDLFKDKYFPPSPQISGNHDSAPLPVKSCLSSGKKRGKEEKNVNNNEKTKKKKKRVRFADDVRETKGNGEVYRREQRRKSAETHHHEAKSSSCGNEILDLNKMPANRAALYSGILRDRVHRMGYSY